MKQLTAHDSGVAVTLQIGEEFTVSLDEIPTTGYRWRVQSDDPEAIVTIASEYVAAGSGIGGGGQRSFRLSATKAGDFSLSFLLERSWEKEAVRQHGFQLNVQA